MRRSISSGLSRLWRSRAAIFNGTILAGLLAVGSSQSAFGQCPPAEPPIAPYLETFDALPNGSPATAANCWTFSPASTSTGWQVDNAGTGSSGTGPLADHTLGTSAGKYIYFETSSTATGATAEVQTTDINIDNLASPELTFYYHMYGTAMGSLDVDVSADGGLTWNNELTLAGNQQATQASPWLQATIGLSAYSGAIRVRFTGTDGTSFTSDMAIDDFKIDEPPACNSITNPISSNITSSSVDLDWTAGDATATAWEVEYGAPGFTPGTGTVMPVTSVPATTISGLTPNTAYTFLIREACVNSPGVFSPNVAISATTLCAPVATWTENWDSHPTGSANTSWGCFGKIGTSGFIYPTLSSSAPSQPNYFYQSGSTTAPATLLLPEVTNSGAGTHRLEFSARAGSSLGCLVAVGYVTDINDASTFVPVDSFTVAYTTPSTVYNPYFIDAAGIVPMGQIALQSYSYWYSDNWSWAQIPSCEDPTAISLTTAGSSTLDVSWSHSGGNAQSFNVEYGPTGFIPGTGSSMTAMGTVATITGLMAQTDYDVYVQADCGANDGMSGWEGPATFTTACTSYMAPYSQDFETSTILYSTFTTDFGNCWTQNAATGDPRWYADVGGTGSSNTGPSVDNTVGTSAGVYMYMEVSSGSLGAEQELFSPYIDVSGLTTPYVEFYYHMAGADMGTLHVDVWDGTMWNLDVISWTGAQHSSSNDPWSLAALSLPGYAGPIQVRFRGERGTSFGGDMAIDDFSVSEAPSCVDPQALTSLNITSTTFDVSWVSSEPNFNIEYGPAGYAQGTGTLMMSATNSASITGLMPQTSYDVYVQSDCGAANGLSGWVGPITVTTLCAEASMPYTEDFDNWPPACWDISSGAFTMLQYGGDYLEAPFWSNNDVTGYAYSQLIDVTADARVKFRWSHLHNATSYPNDQVILLARIAGTPTWDTVVNLIGPSFSSPGASSTVPSPDADFVQEIHNLNPAFTGNIVELRFDMISDFGPDVFIDDFEVSAVPSCPDPTGIAASNITGTTADITWSAVGAASSYNVEYGPAGYTQGTGTLMNVSTNAASLTGLSGLTSYDVYVQSDCGTGQSPWNSVSFTTGCITFPAPYSEDFEMVSPGFAADYGNCWTTNGLTSNPKWEAEDASGLNENSTATGPFYDNTTPGVSGGMYMYLETSGGAGNTNYLTGPSIDVSGLNVPAVFFYYHMYGATMGTLNLEVSSDNGVTWNNVWSLSGQQHAAGGDAWTQAIVPLVGYTGVIQLRFAGTSGSSFNSDMSIDDVSVDEGPSCFPPVSASATTAGYQATLFWSSPETAFEVEYGPAGFTQGSGTIVNTTDTFTVVTGLTPVTSYEYYVRANCTSNNSTFAGPIAFTTTVSCPAPSILGGTVSPTQVTINWNAGGVTTDFNYALMAPGATPTASDILNTTNTTATVGGLTDNTPYVFWVRDSCGAGDVSTWASISFETPCNAQVAPYSQDYDSWPTASQGVIDCWAMSNGNVSGGPFWRSNIGSTGSTNTGPSSGNGGAGGYIYLETSVSIDTAAQANSPFIDIQGLTSPELSFYYHMYGATMGQLRVQVYDGAAWNTMLVITGEQHFSLADAWTKATVDLSAMQASGADTISVRFIGTRNGSFTGDMAIDDFRVDDAPSCANPSMPVVSNIDDVSATVSWTAGDPTATSWNVEYGPTGFAPGSGTSVTASSASYVISGLTAGTTYDFYVSEACASGGFSQSISGSFTTALCAASAQCSYTIDMTDSFGDGWNGCVIDLVQNGVVVASFGSTFTTGTSQQVTIDLCDALSTDVVVNDPGSYSNEVGMSITAPDGSVVYSLSSGSSFSAGQVLGNFTTNCAACPVPSNSMVSNIDDTSADISWTAGDANAISWSVEYGPAGFTPGTGTTLNSGMTTINLSGLMAATSYDYYIYESCVSGGLSNTTSGSFTTAVCATSSQCSYDVDMTDSYGDGWNGFTFDIVQNGVVVATLGANFTSGSALSDSASLCDNVSTDIVVNTPGSFSTEVGMTIYAPDGSVAFSLASGSSLNAGQVLGNFTSSCAPPAPVCTPVSNASVNNITSWTAEMDWTAGDTTNGIWYVSLSSNGTSVYSNIAVAETQLSLGGGVNNPTNGLTPGTTYDYSIRERCSVGDTSAAITGTFTTLDPCYGVDSVSTINAKQGLFRAHYGDLDIYSRNYKLKYMVVGDPSTLRSRNIGGAFQNSSNFNVTPYFGQDVAVWIEMEGRWDNVVRTYESCGDTVSVPCKPQTLQMVEQRSATCAADSVLLRAGYAGGYGAPSILWSNGSTNKRTYASQGQTLTVTITDASGCSVTDSITASSLNNDAVPMNFTLTKNNATTFTGSWDAPALPTGASLVGYRMAYRLRNTQQWTNTSLSNDTFATVDFTGSGLSTGNYEFVAFTRFNDDGNVSNSSFTCREVKGYNGSGNKSGNGTINGSDASNVSIYPNPTNSMLYVSAEQGAEVTLTDMNGKTIAVLNVENAEVSFDMSNLAQGVYMIRIQTDSEIVTDQVIKN